MEIEDLVKAQENLMGVTPNATCPCCEGTSWKGLPAFDHVLATGIVASPGAAPDPLQEELLNLFELGFRQQPLIGIFCTTCGFVRFHVPLPDGI